MFKIVVGLGAVR